MKIGEGWKDLLTDEFSKPYLLELEEYLKDEYSSTIVYPKKEDIFRALKMVDFKDVKILIVGQDPYHGPNQANGLAFAVSDDVTCPPSLRNIFKEIQKDFSLPSSTTLTGWAEQGVLLLNSVLTVRAGEANSHRGLGWEEFTNEIIKCLGNRDEPVIFMLWGSAAKSKKFFINKSKGHLILETSHPSPLSAFRGFLGCQHFVKANNWLISNGKAPIDWSNSG